MTSVITSEASTAREGQNREQEGTFNHQLNQKITLLKLNDDSNTNDLWIWLADAYRYIYSGCSMDALENEIDRSLLNKFHEASISRVHKNANEIGLLSMRVPTEKGKESMDGFL